MKYFLITFSFLLICTFLNAQNLDSLNQDASPKGGINNLAIKYYGIDFSKEQRVLLNDKEIEFIYLIDEKGRPTLSEINGIQDNAINDSLKRKEIVAFNPQLQDGIPIPSIYFMQLKFPTYKMTESKFGFYQAMAHNEAKLKDFEYLNKSNARFDLLFGGLINQFIGSPSKHLKIGGGFKMDMTYTNKSNYLYGLNMSGYFNKLKKDYPINTSRVQKSPATLLVGAIIGKWFNNISIQLEINIAVQNVTEKISNKDKDWVQLNGWSPGVVINYPLKLGKESPMYYYGSPSLFENNINFSFGIRYMSFPLEEASGIMIELGISYRMTLYGIEKYKLKDSYINK